MALKLYDRMVPSDDFPLVSAEHVEMPDGSGLDAFAMEAAGQVTALGERVTALEEQDEAFMTAAEGLVGQVTELSGRVDAVEEQVNQMGSAAEQAIGQLTSLTGRVTALETPAVSVDLTAYESAGTIVETYADGSAKTYTMEFDGDGNPTKVTDSDGNVTVLTW